MYYNEIFLECYIDYIKYKGHNIDVFLPSGNKL